jgi:hypothetical protein
LNVRLIRHINDRVVDFGTCPFQMLRQSDQGRPADVSDRELSAGGCEPADDDLADSAIYAPVTRSVRSTKVSAKCIPHDPSSVRTRRDAVAQT